MAIPKIGLRKKVVATHHMNGDAFDFAAFVAEFMMRQPTRDITVHVEDQNGCRAVKAEWIESTDDANTLELRITFLDQDGSTHLTCE